MAPRKRNSASSVEPESLGDPAFKRLSDLVALLLVKGEPQNEKCRMLSVAGYSAPEIAALVGMTANAVNVALHRLRKNK